MDRRRYTTYVRTPKYIVQGVVGGFRPPVGRVPPVEANYARYHSPFPHVGATTGYDNDGIDPHPGQPN